MSSNDHYGPGDARIDGTTAANRVDEAHAPDALVRPGAVVTVWRSLARALAKRCWAVAGHIASGPRLGLQAGSGPEGKGTSPADRYSLEATIQTLIKERDQYAAERDRLTSQLRRSLAAASLQMRGNAIEEILSASFDQLNHEERVSLFREACKLFGFYFRNNGVFQLQAYDVAEEAGLHILPVHYYSPIVTKQDIALRSGKDIFSANFGIKLDKDAYIAFFNKNIRPFLGELAGIPFDDPKVPGTFFWNNGMFGSQDAATYYAMIRSMRPKRILEIGSGFSTLIATAAAARNGDTKVTCIEPFPVEFFNKHLTLGKGYEFIETAAQDVELSVFRELEEDDILFVDSSHVVKPGSDVEHIIFRILPSLPPGVYVHFHDIFIPRCYDDYNYILQHRHWNENYILAAFLANNRDWDVLLANAYAGDYGAGPILKTLAIGASGGDTTKDEQILRNACGGSIWLRRQGRSI